MANSFEGEFTPYGTWEDAMHDSSGYEDPDLVSNLARQLETQAPWRKMRAADRYLDQRSLELLFALQLAVADCGPEVRVADIGGAMDTWVTLPDRN